QREPVADRPRSPELINSSPDVEDEQPFGAGLFDDDSLTPPDVNEQIDAGNADETTTAAEERPEKRKRRGRRRRRGEPNSAEQSWPPAEPLQPPLPDVEDDQPPRLESAERRTEDTDPSYAGAVEPTGGDEPEPVQSEFHDPEHSDFGA